MKDLTIIMPYVNEYPMNYFTLCGLRCELEQSDLDWEIITIANKNTDKGYDRISKVQTPRIKALKYDDKLSHWNAKNFGIQNSEGKILFFIDAHCILSKNALVNLYNYYVNNYDVLHGSLHVPILYMNELQNRELEYKLIANITDKNGIDPNNPKNSAHNMHYSFTRYKHQKNASHHRVSCTSTCGMMISRDLMVDKLGMWPQELGIYGGGENFVNFTLAVMGYHINVFTRPNVLHHYAEKRQYSWNYDNWIRNRIIASYMSGGTEWSKIFAMNVRGRQPVLEKMWNDVVEKCSDHRQKIKPFIKMSPIVWVEKEVLEGRHQGFYK